MPVKHKHMNENKKDNINNDDDIITWKVPEYSNNKKSTKWFITAGSIASLLLLYSFLTANFAFAVFIILAVMVIILRNKDEVKLIDIAITGDGVVVGEQFYDYDKIKNFAIIYKPDDDKKNLYFEFKNVLLPRLSIALEGINPLLVRENLLKYLEEDLDRIDIPLSEQLTKLFKL